MIRRMGRIGVAGFLAAILAAGCGKSETVVIETESAKGGTEAAPAAAEALPAGLLLDAAPEGAKSLEEVKKSAREGDSVVLRGRVGGALDPFVKGRAMMTVADAGLVPCSEMEMGEDGCITPWDYCCEAPESLKAKVATIEVDGADGRPLKADLRGAGGIAPLDTVVVVGKVGPRPDPAILVIHATGIYREPR